MKKQLTLLLILLAFTLGMSIGLLVTNYSILFALLVIPTGAILFRGAFYESKWNSIIKDLEDKN